MPTLRGPTVAVLILLLSLASGAAFAQQHQVVYPDGLIAIAEKPLPSKVYHAQKNVFQIRVEFHSNQPNNQALIYYGSGFIEKNSGLVVSAKHIIIEPMMDLLGRYSEQFTINESGIPRGVNYHYKFFAVVGTPNEHLEFPLEIAKIYPLGTYPDVITFRPLTKIPLNGLELTNSVKPGDKVYVSGYTSLNDHFHQQNGANIQVNIGKVKFNFENTLLAVIENKQLLTMGLQRTYRLVGKADFGFSGGPVIDKNGHVVGILNSGNNLFYYAVSSKDVKTLLDKK